MTNEPRALRRVDNATAHELIAHAISEGWTLYSLDGARIYDRASFVDELRRHVPLDPPFHSGRSLEAIADSLFGGIDASDEDKSLLVWLHAEQMSVASPDDFTHVVDALSVVGPQLAAPEPKVRVKSCVL
jgi:hypothetical protein